MWKVTEHKRGNSQQEIKVVMLAKEVAENEYITYAQAFEDRFNNEILFIKRTNNYEAWMLYKITARNQKSVELWRLDVKGDYKYKILTIDYSE